MKLSHALWIAVLLTLTACGPSHRVTYSGHEESTDGVPGFVNGKRVSPNVKLGQSYTVDGEEFTPRYQPDYVEEGMASWYGPGFHGGKTANGEQFDKYELTAAHRTLPLPSIVKVTMLSTGRWAYVRINDRGPFAKGRIIDLSRGSADAIGLTAKGTAKVRVEYMPLESQRFANLLAQGRSPKSIDLANEVIAPANLQYFGGNNDNTGNNSVSGRTWDSITPVASADAAETAPEPREVSQETEDSAPVTTIVSNDLTTPASPFNVMQSQPAQQAVKPALAPATTAAGGRYIQLGAFLNPSNAERMKAQYSQYGTTSVLNKTVSDGAMMHYVRMGPFADVEQSTEKLAQLHDLGIDAKLVRE